MSDPLQVLAGCDLCPPDASKEGLFAEVDGRRYCARHWRELPEAKRWPRRPATPQEEFEARAATEKRMLARGGAHAHLVRKGLT